MQLIQRDFDLSWDFRSVAWWATLRFNLLRAASAGVVIGALMAVPLGGKALLYPLAWPLIRLGMLLPMALLVRLFARAFPAIAGVNVALAMAVAVGDPLVCLLKWLRPGWVEMESPPVFALQVAIVLFKPADAFELIHTGPAVGRRQP